MCGRYVVAKEVGGITELFELDEVPEDFNPISYNIAPTQQVGLIVEREIEGLPSRELHSARWGLIPHWSKEMPAAPLFNARSESVLEKPSFKDAALKKRCAIPASGYFEWLSEGETKRPFYIHPAEGMLAFAGIYSWWRDPNKDASDPARWLLSCSVLTKAASPALSDIHERSPIFLSPENLGSWLAPDYETSGELLAALSAESDEVAQSLEFYEVSGAVGSVSNNNPSLIERV
jgi:putative SOS response-associated peptidase YedK